MRARLLLAVPLLAVFAASTASARLAPDAVVPGDTGDTGDAPSETGDPGDTADSGPTVGAADLAGETGGCGGCAATGRPAGAAWVALLLAASLAARRRA